MLITICLGKLLHDCFFSLLNHCSTEGSDTRWDRQTWKLTNLSSGESIDWISWDLQGKLSTIQDSPHEGIWCFLEFFFGLFSGTNQFFEDDWKNTFLLSSFNKVITSRSPSDIIWIKFICLTFRWDIGSIAKIMGHHDRGIKRGEIQGCNGLVVVTFLWINDSSSLELVSSALWPSDWDNEVQGFGFSVKLRGNFDLLTTREQEADGNSGYSCHFCQVEETHEFVQEPQWEVSILDTVDSQSPPCEFILLLKLWDDAVWYIFFLFLKEMIRYWIQRIWSKFVISDDNLHHIELDTSLHVHFFVLTNSQCLDIGCLILDLSDGVLKSTKLGPVPDH
jgi:hypothetical protein